MILINVLIKVLFYSNVLIESHVKHLEDESEEELDKLLCIAVDIDNLYFIISRENDGDTKQVRNRY